MLILTPTLVILFVIAKTATGLKHALFAGLPMASWIIIYFYFIILGIYAFSFSLSKLTYALLPSVVSAIASYR